MSFNLSVYESWFDALVSQSIISRVYHIDIHNINLEQEIKSAYQGGILLVLFSPEINEVGSNIDGSLDEYSAMAFFMKKVNIKTDDAVAQRRQIRNDTLQAAFNVREEMRKIARNNDIPCHFFQHIRPETFSFQKIGPQWDNFYGWVMQFKFQIPLQ
jgi:hypothetical protein